MSAPRRIQIVVEAERAEDLAGHEIGEIVEGLRLLVERRHRRQHHRAGFRAEHHVAELREAHRRLARHDHQPPALLQHHVGRALDQAARQPMGNAGQGLHRARHDRHAAAAMASAGDRRAEIAVAVERDRPAADLVAVPGGQVRHQLFHRGPLAELVAQQAPPVIGDHQLDVDAARQQRRERTRRVHRPARAGDGQRDGGSSLNGHRWTQRARAGTGCRRIRSGRTRA